MTYTVPNLTREDLDQWLAALRSGDYKKGLGRLKRSSVDLGVRYCCLGVFCQVKGYVQQCHAGRFSFLIGGEWQVSNVPEQVLPSELTSELIVLNDSRRNSFEYIADWIEEHVIPGAHS